MDSALAGPSNEKKKNKNRDNSSIRIAIVGAQFVGKSALTLSCLSKRYAGESERLYAYFADIKYRMDIMVDGEELIIELMDTCYQKPYAVPGPERIETSDAMAILYAINDRDSFEHVRLIKNELPKDMPVALVGTKLDLTKFRQVAVHEGQDLAKEFGCTFFEVTSVDPKKAIPEDLVLEPMNDIREVFRQLCREVIEIRNRPKPKTSFLSKILGRRALSKVYKHGKRDSPTPKE